MTFGRALGRIEASRPAIVTARQQLTFGQLYQAGEALAPAMAGRDLVLNHADLIEAATLFAAADGRARSIALMSPQHDVAMLAPLMTLLAPDYVVSPHAAALADAGLAVPVVGVASDIPASDAVPAARTDWIMTTSGTTGTPKLVRHSLASLTRTARLDTDRARGQVWGMVYDYSRFAGLQVMLQSLLSGACLAVPPQDVPLDAQLAFLAARGCTHLSATPTMWRKILMCPQYKALDLRQITLGGEIADDSVLAAVARGWPDARVSHIFASTEAGVGFSVLDGKAGFPAGYLTDPPAGIGLRIAEGRLWVRNEEVGADYLGGRGPLSRDGWVDTGDMVEERDGRVYFKGRESGVINVGGNKVHPEEVERAILAHPQVSMARVYAKPSPIMGALVMADVVALPDAPATLKADLGMFLRGRLEKYMVPAVIRLSDGFEVNAAGKIRRDG